MSDILIPSFFDPKCQSSSKRNLFGLCDDPPPSNRPAYIDKTDGSKWIAIVDNEPKFQVNFTAIDHCIEILKPDGNPEKRCDGVLTYNSTISFVELKVRDALGNALVKDAEEQLRATISHFEKQQESLNFTTKKAYIANSEHPKFKVSQARRMDQFLSDTGYILRIENRIIL
jgi:hypothetical protein